MTRTIVKCLVLIVIVSCIGVYGYRTSSMTSSVSSSNNDVKIGGPNTIYMKDLLKTVKPEVLRKKMKKMTSYHDFIRIFMKNENMSDDEIDDFLQRRTFSDIDVINPVEKKEVMEDDYEPYIQSPDEMAVKAVDHINEVMASPLAECRVPKPELVYIPPEGDKMFAPEYTILHRCRNTTGCCWNRSQTCGVKAIQVVEKFFFSLRSTESQDTQLANDNVVVSKLLLNHTECECKDVNPLPGCDQRCPHPFRKERRTDYCTCECLHDHLPCLKVKYGIESLDPEEFQCVKDDQCMKPQCAEGEFDMRKGYCPGTATLPYQLLFRNKRNAER